MAEAALGFLAEEPFAESDLVNCETRLAPRCLSRVNWRLRSGEPPDLARVERAARLGVRFAWEARARGAVFLDVDRADLVFAAVRAVFLEVAILA